MLKLQQLAHALALSRIGNFHRAAQAQHLSQPAFSRSIRSLEESVGALLFDRQGPAVQPTRYGEVLLRHAGIILAEADELEREVRLLQGLETGSLNVAMGAFAAELSGSRAVGELVRAHPGICCQVKLNSWRGVADMVASRTVDVGLAEISTLASVEHLVTEPVAQHELLLYCRRGHPLLERNEVTRADLDAFPQTLIRVPPRGAELMPGQGHIEADTGDRIPHVEVDDLATARAVVLASDAFSAATPVQIEPWLRGDEFRVLPFRANWLRLNYGFITLQDRMLSPATELFMRLVRQIEAGVAARNRELMDELSPFQTLGNPGDRDSGVT